MGKRKSLFEEEVEVLPEEPVLKVNQDFAKRFEVTWTQPRTGVYCLSKHYCLERRAVTPVAAGTGPAEGAVGCSGLGPLRLRLKQACLSLHLCSTMRSVPSFTD